MDFQLHQIPIHLTFPPPAAQNALFQAFLLYYFHQTFNDTFINFINREVLNAYSYVTIVLVKSDGHNKGGMRYVELF